MPRYRVICKTKDGRHCERTLRADDPAAALGTVLDEHANIDDHWFMIMATTSPTSSRLRDLPIGGLHGPAIVAEFSPVPVAAPIAALLEKLTGCKVEKETP